MTPQTATSKAHANDATLRQIDEPLSSLRLTNRDEAEVSQFLEERPLQNVIMNGFVRDNGIESSLNRGTFYGCRDADGLLAGVALIGHGLFIDARNESALRLLARTAQACEPAHMILGEETLVRAFWKYYSPNGAGPRLVRRDVLFQLSLPLKRLPAIEGLRRATLDDLSLIVPVHATLAHQESGINPLEVDPEGFRRRCQHRVTQGRVWIRTDSGRLIFKADLISDTPRVIYVEGVYVHPDERGKGYGSQCILQMASELLHESRSLSVLVNEANRTAQSFFQNLGFVSREIFETIFLPEKK